MNSENPKGVPLPVAEGIAPRILVVMGVSGSGKSTVAEGLHNVLGWPFQEGDALHPKANVDKMAAGIPLTDEDRWPWLNVCRDWIGECVRNGTGGILTCSSLKRIYRDRLRQGGVDVTFLFLRASEEILAARMQRRKGHYMPASLLSSQLATLEIPETDEHVLVVDLEMTPAAEVALALTALREDRWAPPA